MDVNKMIADMWKRICCIDGEVQGILVGGSFWTIQGNLGIGPDHYLGTNEAQPLIFKTNKLERLRVLSDGKIGIKTDTPTVDLDLNGILRIRGGNPANGKILQCDANGVASWVTPSAGTTYTFESGLNLNTNVVRLGGVLLDNAVINSGTVGFDVILNGTVDSTNNNTTDAYLQVNTTGVGPAIGVTSDKDGILVVASTLGLKISGAATGADIASSGTGLIINSSGGVGQTINAATIGLTVVGGTQGVNTSVGGVSAVSNNSALIAASSNASAPTVLFTKVDNAGSISGQAIPLDVFIIRRNNGNSVAIPIGAGVNFKMQMQQASTILEAFRISAITNTVGGQNTDVEFWNLKSTSQKHSVMLSTGQWQWSQYTSTAFTGGSRMLTVDPADGKIYTAAIPVPSTGTVNAADQGLSLSSTTAQLGTDVTAASNAALINTVREIPFALGTGILSFTNRTTPNLKQSFTSGMHTLQGVDATTPTWQMSIADLAKNFTLNWNQADQRFVITVDNLRLQAQVQIQDGTQGIGKVFTSSDANGNGAWANPFAITPFVSADFEPDGTTVIDTSLNGRTYELFFNDLNRFLAQGTEWDYVIGGGYQILIPGFDANTNNYNLYLFFKQ